MKGKIIKKEVSASKDILSYSEEFDFTFLVVEEADNLAIAIDNMMISVQEHFSLTDNDKVLREVDVPDELVEKALDFLRVEKEFHSHIDQFKALFTSRENLRDR